MARKAVKTDDLPERMLGFRAPDKIHGALKSIAAGLEMSGQTVGDSIPYERDILQWLIADLYLAGPDEWPKRLNDARNSCLKLLKPQSK